MGHRASFVVVQDGKRNLFYSNFGANTLPHDLFFGPDLALRSIEGLLPADSLLDEVWCEGAAFLDRDARRVLLYFEDTRYTSKLLPYYLALSRYNWPGWEVCWADQGIVDIAIAIGINPNQVRDDAFEEGFWKKAEVEVSREESPVSLITIGCRNNAVDYGFEDLLTNILEWGPELIDRLKGYAQPPLYQDKDIEEGAYLNPERKEMWLWWTGHQDNRRVARIASFWPGWSVRRHNEGLRKQVELSGRDATRLDIDLDEAIQRIVRLLSEVGSSSAQLFDPAKALQTNVGDDQAAVVQIDLKDLRRFNPEFDAKAKEWILRRTIAAFRKGRESHGSALTPAADSAPEVSSWPSKTV